MADKDTEEHFGFKLKRPEYKYRSRKFPPSRIWIGERDRTRTSPLRWWDDSSLYELVLIGLLEAWRFVRCNHGGDLSESPYRTPISGVCYDCQYRVGGGLFEGYYSLPFDCPPLFTETLAELEMARNKGLTKFLWSDE